MMWLFGEHVVIAQQLLTDQELRIVKTDERIVEKHDGPAVTNAHEVPALT